MNVLVLLLLLVLITAFLHAVRFWPRVALAGIVVGITLLLWSALTSSPSSLDVLSMTVALEPYPRDLLTLAFGLTGLLAVATILAKDRSPLGFLFWPWLAWLSALSVSDFVVSAFAWALGMIACVLAMKPRKFQRASGAAYFLVLVVIAAASLLLAYRFVALYPLTPERTTLIDLAVLSLAWGFGILFSIFPFQLWVGPMTDDAPLVVTALLLGLGQPVGFWILLRFLGQFPWLVEKSGIFDLIYLGGLAAVITAGVLAAVERRAGRLLGYAAMFSMGFVLLNLGSATRDGIGYAGVEILVRAVGLIGMAGAIQVGRNAQDRVIKRAALVTFIIAGLSLVGIRLGVSLGARWNLFITWIDGDWKPLALVVIAHTGLLVGIIRFAQEWLREETSQPEAVPFPLASVERVRVAAPASAMSARSERVPAPSSAIPSAAEQVSPLGTGGDGHASAASSQPASGNGHKAGEESEEYVFEEHVRELAQTLMERLGPQIRRLALGVPVQTRGTIGLIWRTYRVWTGAALLVALLLLVVLVSAVPTFYFNRILGSLGPLPFVQ